MRVTKTHKGGLFYGLDDSFDLCRKCVRDLIKGQTSLTNLSDALASSMASFKPKHVSWACTLQ